jgi:hypothetical protein
MITGVRDGMATECTNRLKDALAGASPPPQVVYEMQMGSEVAGAYYARQSFYAWLLDHWRLDGPGIGRLQEAGGAAGSGGFATR